MNHAEPLERRPDACPKCSDRLRFRTAKWNRVLDIMELECSCGWTCIFPPADRQPAKENES